jgi:2,5-furandicarboxylate decarboxylase 1
MFNDLREFIKYLEKSKEIITVEEELSPLYEIPAAMKYMDKSKNLALLFKRVKGYDIPIIGSLLGSKRRLALALRVKGDLITEYLDRRKNPIKPKLVSDGAVKEVIIDKDIDIKKTIPVLTHHKGDVSPYFTTAIAIAKDPETGLRSAGLHRVQIKDSNKVGIFLETPPIATFFKKAEAMNKPLKIALAIGVDPITFFSSVIWAPEGIDKFEVASGLAKRPLEMIKCESIDVEAPANAEFVLEGEVLPNIREKEGPFGESTGYYFTFNNPVAIINVITHRKDPIYHALMPFTNEEGVLLNFSWETDNLRKIREDFPNLLNIHFASNTLGILAIAQIEKRNENDAKEIMEKIFELSPFTKIIIVVDGDVNLEDPHEVNWALATRVQPERDVFIKHNQRGMGIDPSIKEDGTVSKIGIDATGVLRDADKYEKVSLPNSSLTKARKILDRYLKGEG